MLLIFCAGLLYLGIGWELLNRWIKYSPAQLQREMAKNGVPNMDDGSSAVFAAAYLFVLAAWPVSIYRWKRDGCVIGEKD